MRICHACESLPDFFAFQSRFPDELEDRTEQVAVKAGGWLQLYRCNQCGQHWQIDVWDKYQTLLTIKIEKPSEWGDFDDTPIRKEHLVESHGGFGAETCRWKDCQRNQLKGIALCEHHAYEEMGARG